MSVDRVFELLQPSIEFQDQITPPPTSMITQAKTPTNEGSSRSNIKTRRSYKKWKKKEVEALKKGVKESGLSNWNVILHNYKAMFDPVRTQIDLKDKWRGMNKKPKSKSNTPPVGVEATPPPAEVEARATPKRRLELEFRAVINI